MVITQFNKTMEKPLEGLTTHVKHVNPCLADFHQRVLRKEEKELVLQHQRLDRIEYELSDMSPRQRADIVANYLTSKRYNGVSVIASKKKSGPSEIDVSQIRLLAFDVEEVTRRLLRDESLREELKTRLVMLKDGEDTVSCRNDKLLDSYVESFTERYGKEPTSAIIGGVFPHTNTGLIITIKRDEVSIDDYVIGPNGVEKLNGW
ncbi:MAG TPA: hypothetical protein VKE88_03740 [Candidatus Nanoarchaeia archaeon]|nr:hypothetical protein [Candidatus Nanoarchaeia archaeon]